jgi:WD40 repeat protein
MRLFAKWIIVAAFGAASASLLAFSQDAKDQKAAQVIDPVDPNLGRAVDFERDVYPILDAKCMACHNVAINENGLNLEDVKNILKGGKRGPAVVPKDLEKSLLFKLAARGMQPAMPPLPNKVEAAALTGKELGIIKQWILEGANAGMGGTAATINWHPLPKGVNPIYAVAITPDGQYAAAGRGNELLIYHVPTGDLVAQLADPALRSILYNGQPMYEPNATHRDYVHSLAFSPSGNMLASGSFREVKLWARPDNWQRANLAIGGGPVTAVAVSADNKWLAVGAADHSIKLFNAADGQLARSLAGHAAAVTALVFSADGSRLYSSSHDKSIRGWSVADGAAAGRIDTVAAVNGLALTPDGAKVVAACADNLLRVFSSPAASVALATSPGAVPSLAVSTDKKTVALAEADGKITIIDVASAKVARQLEGHSGALAAVCFSANGAKLASGGADKTLRIWDLATGQAVVVTAGIPNAVTAIAWHPQGAQLAAGFADGQVALFKVDVAEPPVERMLAGNGQAITGLVYSPQGESVFSACADGNLRRYQVSDGAQQWAQAHGAAIHDLAQSPDGQFLATAAENNQVRIWVAANGSAAPKPALEGFPAAVRSVAFAADNTRLAAGTANNLVFIEDFKTGVIEQIISDHAGSVEALAYAGENARMLISASADKLTRLHLPAFERQIGGHGGPVTSVAIVPPQGARVASGSDDGTLRIWELANGNQVASLGHGAAVTAVAVSPDGQRYASAGANALAILWNASNNQQIAQMKGDLRAVRAVEQLTADEAEAKGALNVATAAVPAAEKTLSERTEAQKKAAEAKTAAEKTAAEMAEKARQAQAAFEQAKKAADDKKDDQNLQKAAADAQKTATDAAAAAKKAEEDKNAAVKALEQQDKAVAEASGALAKAKTVLEETTASHKAAEAALAAGKTQQAEKEKPVRALAFSRDGRELAWGGEAGQVCTFDGLTAQPLHALDGHAGPVRALAYAGIRSLVSASDDQTAKVWDLNPEWKLVAVLGPKKDAPQDLSASVFVSRVLCLDFSDDGRLLAAGGGDPSRSGELTIWNVADGQLVRSLENAHSDTVFGVEFSRNGKLLLSGAADKFVKIHEVETGKLFRSFEGHTNHVLDVSWRADMKQVASAGADNAIKVWNVESGEQQRTIGGFAKQVTSIQYMGRGGNFVSCSGDKTVRFHTADNGNNFRNFGGAADFMYAAAASEKEQIVIAGGQDGVLRVWNGANAQSLRTFEPPKPPPANEQAQAR